MHHTRFHFLLMLLFVGAHGLRFDEVPSIASRPVQDRQLQEYIRTSCRWLQYRSVHSQYPLLNAYAEQLQLVLRTECAHCVDYYEAAGLLGLLGKTASQIMKEARDDVHYPVVRRSYIAAVWLLQRSRQFVWETTHMPSTALSTMFRLYLGHVHRAKGRTVSLHHISKCGGTTMCQLAASNRCSNPHLSQEKNCVLNDKLDAPLWMVGHNVSPQGVMLNPAIGTLDTEPVTLDGSSNRIMRRFSNEPKMDMWLMYACPYAPNGRLYDCKARAADAHESGTTFLANERTLTKDAGQAQVCTEFLNTVILREPVPHAISIMAEAKFRYVRQMATKHSITNWQPTAWNLTWWETLGPALVGNYATRTLLGRESLCRSAANMGQEQLDGAVDALMSFDMVMTLGRSTDIDLVITTMLGWPARNFSSQPGARVREVSVELATKGQVTVGDSKASKGSTATARHLLIIDGDSSSSSNVTSSSSSSEEEELSGRGRSLLATNHVKRGLKNKGSMRRRLHGVNMHRKKLHGAQSVVKRGKASRRLKKGVADGGGQQPLQEDPAAGANSGSAAAAPAATALGTNMTAKELEQQAALMLVSTTWHELQAEMRGVTTKSAVWAVTGQPRFELTGQRDKHGAHLVMVHYMNKQRIQESQVWHSFPRHTFAFLASDIERLERLTNLDLQVYNTADLMFNLDSVWLQTMLSSSHYRKKLRALAATHTSCGFAGMIPVDPELLKETVAEA